MPFDPAPRMSRDGRPASTAWARFTEEEERRRKLAARMEELESTRNLSQRAALQNKIAQLQPGFDPDEPSGFGKALRGTQNFALAAAANLPAWGMRAVRKVSDVAGSVLPDIPVDPSRITGPGEVNIDPLNVTSDILTKGIEGYESWLAERRPEGWGWMLGRMGSELVTEGGMYVVGGGWARNALGKIATSGTARSLAPRVANQVARLGVRSPGILKEAAKDAIAVSPIDWATAQRREESLAGFAAEMAPEGSKFKEFAEGVAANPWKRFLAEAGTGFLGDVAVRGSIAKGRAGREFFGAESTAESVREAHGGPLWGIGGTGYGDMDIVQAPRLPRSLKRKKDLPDELPMDQPSRMARGSGVRDRRTARHHP